MFVVKSETLVILYNLIVAKEFPPIFDVTQHLIGFETIVLD